MLEGIARPILVAELGKVHGGNMKTAKFMIDNAKQAGCDFVKLQAYNADSMPKKHSNYKRYKQCHLTIDQLVILKVYCESIKIGCFCSIFNADLVPQLAEKGFKFIKIPSTYLGNKTFVDACANHFVTLHVSTGFHRMDQIDDILEKNYSRYKNNLVFYHCVSSYPAKKSKLIRLTEIVKIVYQRFNMDKLDLGYSDHTEGVEAMVHAWLMGANWLEFHFNPFGQRKTWEKGMREIAVLQNTISFSMGLMEDTHADRAQEEKNLAFYKTEFPEEWICDGGEPPTAA